MSSPIRQLLAAAQSRLVSALALSASEARIEAQMLMRRVLGDVSRAWLMAHDNEIPLPVQADLFTGLLQRRLCGEPVAYILGGREFYGIDLTVTPEVLIPRPDTETLVEAALARIPESTLCRVLDLGTGSGAIAIAIAVNRPQARVTGVDRSSGAAEVARANAGCLQLANVSVLVSDWFSGLGDQVFDVIVSNPPYIAEHDPHLTLGDLRFEPLTALASGRDGLDDIRHLVLAAPRHLVSGGWLLLEHGYDQAEMVAQLMMAAGFVEVGKVNDLAGIARVTMGRVGG